MKLIYFLTAWYLIIIIYFISLFCNIYLFIHQIEVYFPFESFQFISYLILFFTIIFSWALPIIKKNDPIYLKSLALIKVMFYFVILFVGSFYLNFLSLLGEEYLSLKILLMLIFLILFLSSSFEFYFLWGFSINHSILDKKVVLTLKCYLIAVFTNLAIGLYYLGQYTLISENSFRFYGFLFIYLGGDYLSGVLFEKLDDYWDHLNNMQKISSAHYFQSFFLSEQFYKYIFFPIYLIFFIFYLIISFPYFLMPFENFQTVLFILLSLKLFLILDFLFHLYKRKRKLSHQQAF